MGAFRAAVELGYRYLETDVHSSSDGVIVAFHDPDLHRTCGLGGVIGELTWSEISTARVADTEPIPRLDDLFEEFPDARFNIDCKSDPAVPGLVAAIRRHRALERVCLAAFSDRRLARLRLELGPGLLTALGPAEVAGLRTLGSAAGRWITARAAQVPIRQGPVTIVNRRFVDASHRLGIAVHVWTVDEPDQMRRLLDLGVDGIMTDRPEILRDVLIEREQWHAH